LHHWPNYLSLKILGLRHSITTAVPVPCLFFSDRFGKFGASRVGWQVKPRKPPVVPLIGCYSQRMAIRMRLVAACALLALAFAIGSAFARGHGGYGHSSYRASSYHYTSRARSSRSYGGSGYRSHAYGSRSHYSTRSHSSSHPFYSRHPNTRSAYGVQRNRHGRIARSEHAKRAFERQHPCPSTGRSPGRCPGYVIDHVRALKRGGPDDPSNMQWQTTEAAKAKDRTE
jgi:hypothetical protein